MIYCRQPPPVSFSESLQLLFRRGPTIWLLIASCLFFMAGCGETEGIRSYTVKRSEPATKPRAASRMLAAIIPRGQEAWFFKLTGPDTATASQAEAFTQLIKSLRFSAGPSGEPQWALPPGWTQQPGNAMRFATLEIDADGESLECSVSKLSRTEQPLEDYLLANINRWRGQLHLASIAAADLPQQTTTVTLGDDSLQATLINIVGESTTGGMGAAPFAGGGARAPFAGTGASPRTSAAPVKLSFRTPTGWTPGELEISRGGVVVRRDAVFEVKDGDKRVEITVTKLPAAGGAMLPNINRWRGQIGLEAISAEQFDKEKKQIEVAGTPADYVQFSGSDQAIFGVIAERNGLAWFVKLQGQSDLAGRERQNFEDFVRSIRFE